MANFSTYIWKILIFGFFYSTCEPSTDNFQKPILNDFNGHRTNADLSKLYWDTTLEQQAASASVKVCKNFNYISDYNQYNSFAVHTNYDSDTDEADYYKRMSTIGISTINFLYNTVCDDFQYSPNSLLGCKSKVALSSVEYFEKCAHFLSVAMDQNVKRVGCSVREKCSNSYSSNFFNVMVCVFSPSPYSGYNFDRTRDAPFGTQSFLDLCKNEGGSWKSCDSDLNEKCKDAKQSTAIYVFLSPGAIAALMATIFDKI